jgi:hypothetical protein
MKARLMILCLTAFTACINTPSPSDDDTSAPDSGTGEPSRRRQRVDAGPTGPGTFRFTVSGERFAREGSRFPPLQTGAPFFVDGWEVQIDHVLVVIDKIALWENPDRSATDPTQVGAKVAEVSGPWVVDLHLPGRGAADGGSTDGGSVDGGIEDGGITDGGAVDAPIVVATLGDQNLAGHIPFDETKRYAISYEIVRASSSARPINLDNDGTSELPNMREKQYSVYYIGSAIWRGTPDTCPSTDSEFDFSPPLPVGTGTVPREVIFKLGFKTPTRYVNCQNPDLPGGGIGSEEHPRGVKAVSASETVVQLTVRADQLFWENYDGTDAPLHFDQFAVAARPPVGGGTGPFRLDAAENLVRRGGILTQNYTAFAVPWRSCSPSVYTPPDQNTRMGFQHRLYYDPSLPTSLSSTESYRDYYDLASHIQSGQGYLGARGRCAVQRQFPSRP